MTNILPFSGYSKDNGLMMEQLISLLQYFSPFETAIRFS